MSVLPLSKISFFFGRRKVLVLFFRQIGATVDPETCWKISIESFESTLICPVEKTNLGKTEICNYFNSVFKETVHNVHNVHISLHNRCCTARRTSRIPGKRNLPIVLSYLTRKTYAEKDVQGNLKTDPTYPRNWLHERHLM